MAGQKHKDLDENSRSNEIATGNSNSNKIIISIDLMGGDHGPEAIIEAIETLLLQKEMNHTEHHLLLCGDCQSQELLANNYKIPSQLYTFIHSPISITNNDNPLDLMRGNKKGSSMHLAIEAVAQGNAQAVLSSGNTGAIMVLARKILGCIPGIKRPAIAGTIPTRKGYSVMLDLGANLECDENILLQFALMGSCFAKAVLPKHHKLDTLLHNNIHNSLDNNFPTEDQNLSSQSICDNNIHKENNAFNEKNSEKIQINFQKINELPTVALLNVGVEETKGRAVEKRTFDLLKKTNLNFIGYIEGHDIIEGAADVVVTDGYTGNLVLKTAEGVALYMLSMIKNAASRNIFSKIGALLMKSSLKASMNNLQPHKNNGAMLVGLNGIVVKSHGGSKAAGVANAIKSTIRLINANVNQQIIVEMGKISCHQKMGLDLMDKIKNSSAKLLNILKFNERQDS